MNCGKRKNRFCSTVGCGQRAAMRQQSGSTRREVDMGDAQRKRCVYARGARFATNADGTDRSAAVERLAGYGAAKLTHSDGHDGGRRLLMPGLDEWVKDAACRDKPTAIFFPDKSEHGTEARAVCADCPVIYECYRYAMGPVPAVIHGIWGGTSEKQRRATRSVTGGREAWA